VGGLTDDLARSGFIRYDVYVNDLLQTVVVGTTSAGSNST
jgi:hypothetical protein